MYNEEAGIGAFAKNLNSVLEGFKDETFKVLWVNDGSADRTLENLQPFLKKSGNIEHLLIDFSKNFGHEAAMIAGIDHSDGDAVICMDSDGQHPPEKIAELVKEFQDGAEIVLTERTHRGDGNIFMRLASKFFYVVLNKLAELKFERDASDFFLISRRVADLLKNDFRERNRFIRGFIQSIGFNKATVQFEAPQRAHGESNYSFFSLTRLSLNAIFSFSDKPLRLTISISLMFITFTVLLGLYSLFIYFFHEKPPGGYTTIILLLTLSFSLLFVTITVLSTYFEKALREIRSRPIYIIKSIHGEEPTETATVLTRSQAQSEN
jgi:dolichol-phosphate mannosyltransferase